MSAADQQELPLHRRPVRPADADYIRALYASARAAEIDLIDWPPAQKEAFVSQQNEAQLRHYGSHFPHAVHEIILLTEAGGHEMAVGRTYTDYGPDEIRLLDITVAAAYRNRGIGGQLMRDLLARAAAAALPIRFHVFQGNRAALRFYRRLGFKLLDDTGAYLEMGWDSPA